MALAPVAALIVLMAGLAVLLQSMLAMVHAAWIDQYGAHSHGYLVLVLAGYFAWRILRAAPDGFRFKPSVSAFIPLAMVLGAAFAARALFIGPIQTGLVPLIAWFSIALCLGWLTALRLAWPCVFLYFAVPIGSPINPLLQELTTLASTALLGLTHIPFYVEGSYVQLASGTFEIASGCSGLNYLMAALTIAATQCTLQLSTTAARARLMAAAVLAALCANWIRVASLIAIGHYSEMRHYLIRVEHFWFGWLLFLVLFAPVVLYGRRLAGREPDGAGNPKPLLALPSMRWAWLALAGASASLLLAGTLFVLSLQPLPADLMKHAQTRMASVDAFASGWQPYYVGGQAHKSVIGDPPGIEIYRLKYASETRDAYLGYPWNSATGANWSISERDIVDLDAANGLSVIEYRGRLHNEEYILWELPVVGGRLVQSRARRLVATVVARLTGRFDSELWALQVACRGDCARARGQLRAALAP